MGADRNSRPAHTATRTATRVAASIAAIALVAPLATACWSDVNESQGTDSVTAYESNAPAGQGMGEPATTGSGAAGAPGPAATPVDTSTARRDTLGGDTLGTTTTPPPRP